MPTDLDSVTTTRCGAIIVSHQFGRLNHYLAEYYSSRDTVSGTRRDGNCRTILGQSDVSRVRGQSDDRRCRMLAEEIDRTQLRRAANIRTGRSIAWSSKKSISAPRRHSSDRTEGPPAGRGGIFTLETNRFPRHYYLQQRTWTLTLVFRVDVHRDSSTDDTSPVVPNSADNPLDPFTTRLPDNKPTETIKC